MPMHSDINIVWLWLESYYKNYEFSFRRNKHVATGDWLTTEEYDQGYHCVGAEAEPQEVETEELAEQDSPEDDEEIIEDIGEASGRIEQAAEREEEHP